MEKLKLEIERFNNLNLSNIDVFNPKFGYQSTNKAFLKVIKESNSYIQSMNDLKYWILHSKDIDFISSFTCPYCSKIKQLSHKACNNCKDKVASQTREINCIKKYGVKSTLLLSEVREKQRLSYFNKTGYNNPLSNPEVTKARVSKTDYKEIGKSLSKYWKANPELAKERSNKAHTEDSSKKLSNSMKELWRSASKEWILDRNSKISNWYRNPDNLDKIKEKTDKTKRTHLRRWANSFDKEVKVNRNEVYESNHWLESEIDSKIISNSKSVIPPLELDIYIPEYNLAIEYNGLYSNYFKRYHYNKSKLCEEKGVRLIHIWDYEWNNPIQQRVLKNIILSACNKSIKLYARKLSIKVISNTDKDYSKVKEFFKYNNIQGFRGGKFAICLMDKDDIVMSYLMGKSHFRREDCWEVIRGATKLGYTVIGGASKIWKYFVLNYSPNNCVYYVDYNYFNGNSILKLDSNYRYVGSQPSYKNWWVNENRIKNREPLRHKEITRLQEQGLVIPVFNSGTKTYLWNKLQG